MTQHKYVYWSLLWFLALAFKTSIIHTCLQSYQNYLHESKGTCDKERCCWLLLYQRVECYQLVESGDHAGPMITDHSTPVSLMKNKQINHSYTHCLTVCWRNAGSVTLDWHEELTITASSSAPHQSLARLVGFPLIHSVSSQQLGK